MSNTPHAPKREDIRRAARSGGARKDFIAAVRKALADCDQGRAASASIGDIKQALHALDGRRPDARKA